MSKGRIVFFDATEVRREKMRNAAMGVKAPKAVNPDVELVDKNVTPPIVEPAPKAEVKVEKPEVKVEEPAAAAPAPVIAVSKEELESALIAFVVEQTGYPEEMVEMDADLEGDLGIDSIKKAQLMGELNEKYHFVDVSAPADNDMSLDDFPTLASIRDYLLSKAGESQLAMSNEQLAIDTSAAPVPMPTPEPEPESAPEPAPAPKSSGAAPTVSVSKEELEAALVSFVVEQTGYPEEMVEMDADLEGDLGIDSIKKAQLMGELNEKYHFVDVSAPADNDMSLDDFPTLASIRDYLLGKAGETETAPVEKQEVQSEPQEETAPTLAPASAPKASAQSPNFKEELAAFLINFVVEQTGYPEEMVEMDVDLEADLGIDSIKKAQLFGELSEKYELVPLGDMSLDDFKTLRDIFNAILQCAR